MVRNNELQTNPKIVPVIGSNEQTNSSANMFCSQIGSNEHGEEFGGLLVLEEACLVEFCLKSV